MPSPNRVLISADLESTGLWTVGARGDRSGKVSDLLDARLSAELKAWNDSADTLFGGRVRPGEVDRDAIAAFWATARQLAVRVQEQLGNDWEVLWSVAEPDWCWSWVRRPTAW